MLNLFKILLISSFITLSAQGATLGLDDASEPSIILRDDAGITLNELFYKLSGDGSTADAAVTLYVPLKDSGALQDSHYYHNNAAGGGANLGDMNSTSGGIYFADLDSIGHVSEELYVAVKDNDNGSGAVYRIVAEIAEANMEAPFVSFAELCITSELNCSGITNSISAIKDDVELVFFFMPKDTNYSLNEEVTIPETVGQSFFFRLIISAASTATNSATVGVVGSYAGDTTAIIDYIGDKGTNSEYINRMAVYLNGGGSDPLISDFRNILETQPEEGNAKITGLTVGNTYRASLAFIDYFGFSTARDASGGDFTTRPIEKLLAESQCYLVSAGFQREHYVLDYFRHIRDEYLLKTWAGRLFVSIYYGTAPKFVDFIISNKSLSFKIRTLSFSIYFVLHNITYIILLLLILATLTYRRELNHALQGTNRR